MDRATGRAGAMLRAARVASGRSVLEMAVEAGISVQAVYNIEAGRSRPRVDVIARLLDAAMVPAERWYSFIAAYGERGER